MDRSRVLTLIKETYTTDALMQYVPTETSRNVFCNVQSVSRSEFFDAGQSGLKPEYVATMFAPDYEGEKLAVLDGKRYGIYRTYIRQDEQIELYLESKVGVDGTANPTGQANGSN